MKRVGQCQISQKDYFKFNFNLKDLYLLSRRKGNTFESRGLILVRLEDSAEL